MFDVWLEGPRLNCGSRYRRRYGPCLEPRQDEGHRDNADVSKDGTPKIVKECSLPLTGARAVSLIVTDLAVFKVDRVAGELTLTDIAEGLTLDELRAKTACDFRVADVLATF